jgi:hypothetical protein
MGWHISWLAVQGIDKAEVYRRIDATPTGEIGMMLDHPACGKLFSGGWTVVVFDDGLHPLVEDDEVARLSAGCSILACTLDENTMSSTACLWKNGEQVWGVWNVNDDEEEDDTPLTTHGTLPVEFDQLKALAHDTLDIPMELARRLTPFRHDEGPDDFEFLDLP